MVVDADMRAWTTHGSGDARLTIVPVPEIAAHSLLVRVEACGVCRTDLHVIDGDIARHRDPVIPGHQVVGEVIATGSATSRFAVGDRVGVAWLAETCGSCRWCISGKENLCPNARFTGWDVDGGHADQVIVDERFAYAFPAGVDPVDTAPLLCAGIIGFRALSRARLPAGGALGVYGFGSSGHLTAQMAAAQGATVHVMTRGEHNRALARALNLGFVGEEAEEPPSDLDAAIVFAPAGPLVLAALRATAPGGTVVLAGIHMSDIPAMSYEDHLFGERDLRTVTANTREDGEGFLRLAGNLGLKASVSRYRFADTGRALDDLRAGRAAGSLVIDRSLR
ncbi:zinc-binding alcohol dehydrogenase family protein [Microbacterium cremeum]|uniref:zinc-binding alcohol dehydrogenase family protein n=1 Tax=Microbacterium cremeum TaxID=2782169 RepID=UPI0018883B7B|nr:zinc-binding alcohol dehydrogenase family protein [Microbacterium cremeum]